VVISANVGPLNDKVVVQPRFQMLSISNEHFPLGILVILLYKAVEKISGAVPQGRRSPNRHDDIYRAMSPV
jgi:hypothetical protein